MSEHLSDKLNADELSSAPGFRLLDENVVPTEIRLAGYLVGAVVFAAIFLTLFRIFSPSLLFSATTTTGGDTGAHLYLPYYLMNHLLPKGQLFGWAPGWYAGFPALTFYFPLPTLLIAVLAYLVPFQIAFKLITVAGTFLMPISAYVAFKVLDFDYPMPEAAALVTLPFLLMESFNISGGNILSTLAGEFSYSLAFALVLPSVALIYRGVTTGRSTLFGAISLAVTALCHILPAIMIVISALFTIAGRSIGKRILRLTGIMVLGASLTAFWTLPFRAKMGYTAQMLWDQSSLPAFYWPTEFKIIGAIGLVGALFALIKKEERMLPIAALGIAALLIFRYLPNGPVWRGRFLPFWFYSLDIFAAYAIYSIAKIGGRFVRGLQRVAIGAILIAIAAWGIAMPAIERAKTGGSWAIWNYSGYEGKPGWKAYRAINQYLKKLPTGRVMWEYSPAYEKFGTPRAFEVIPYWTGQPTMEGTLIESSITAPFHFINQAELSLQPTDAIPEIEYPSLNIEKGLKHLALYNIRYLMVSTNTVRKLANASPALRPLKRIGEFSIYELKTDGYVTIPKYRPLRGNEKNWRTTALAWYADEDKLDTPIVFGNDPALNGFTSVDADLKGFTRVPIGISGSISDIKLSDEELTFKTSAIGMPHLVKISYFPNWQVDGADGPYLVSPSTMMVIPRRNLVRLYYGKTFSDYAGLALTVSALACISIILWRRRPDSSDGNLSRYNRATIRKRRRRPRWRFS